MFLDLELEARLHILTWGGVGGGQQRRQEKGWVGLDPVCWRGPPADICYLHSFLEVIVSMTTNSIVSNDTTYAPIVLDAGNLKSLY